MKKAKIVGKADRKGKENHQNIPSAIATPNPAATGGNLDTRIANAEKDNMMRKKRPGLPTPTTPSTLLTSKLMRPP
jgi:hypothetical protein